MGMVMYDYFFFLFTFLMLSSAVGIIFCNNPVTAVIYLIIAFGGASGFLLLLGLEYLALMLLVVYVGAVAIIFVFVIMILDIKTVELYIFVYRLAPLALILALIFLTEVMNVIEASISGVGIYIEYLTKENAIITADFFGFSQMEHIGLMLFYKYFHFLLLAGVILLLAMMGSIVLTLHFQTNVKRQNVFEQFVHGARLASRLLRALIKKGINEALGETFYYGLKVKLGLEDLVKNTKNKFK